MNVRRPVLTLTLRYSALFFAFVWALSGGVYVWVNGSLGAGYVNRVNEELERSAKRPVELADDTAVAVADVTIDQLRNILLIVNGLALGIIPASAYAIARRTLDATERAYDLQRHFAQNVSHELRTPLAVVLAEAEWAAKKTRSAEGYASSLASIRREVAEMSATIERLLSVTGRGNGVELTITSVPIEPIVQMLIESVRTLADERHVDIRSTVGSDSVSADEGLLRVALRNLIDNAVRYSPRHTTVSVDAYSTGNYVVLTVTNQTRTVWSRQRVRALLSPGERGPKIAKPGHGYGLPMAVQVIGVLGGTIRVRADRKTLSISVKLARA